MTIEDLVKSEGIWNSEEKSNADIVLKSSIKFSRNIEGYVFPHKLNRKEKEALTTLLLEKIEENKYCSSFTIYHLDKCSSIDKRIFFERNILQDDTINGSALVLSHDENYHFLLNGLDHFKFITNSSGYHFDRIYVFGKRVLTDIEKRLGFTYSPGFGYLTSSLRDSGSGIKLSMTLHLAGMVYSGRMNELIIELNKNGLQLNGSWIDGYYEIYNEYSTGLIEKDIYKHTLLHFQNIIKKEVAVRESIYSSSRRTIEDKVWRSYGLLLSCRLISLFEALDLLSHLRFGLSLGIINYLTLKDINVLLFYIQDYHLRKRYNILDKDVNLEEVRALFIRDYLKEVL